MDPAFLVGQLNGTLVPDSSSGVAAVPAAAPVPDAALVGRFERLLAQGPVSDDLVGPADLAAGPASGQVRPSQDFFDALANAADTLSSGLSQSWEAIRRAGQPPAGTSAAEVPLPPLSEMMSLQRDMVEFAFLFETIGKGTAKAIDNTNQLVKMQ